MCDLSARTILLIMAGFWFGLGFISWLILAVPALVKMESPGVHCWWFEFLECVAWGFGSLMITIDVICDKREERRIASLKGLLSSQKEQSWKK